MQPFSRNRMVESELPRMEHQARGGEFVLFSVNRIAEDGRALVVEVDADLVGAAGVEVAEDEGGFCRGIRGKDFVIRDRGFSARRIHDGHFLAVHRMPTDVGEDGILFRSRNAVGDR